MPRQPDSHPRAEAALRGGGDLFRPALAGRVHGLGGLARGRGPGQAVPLLVHVRPDGRECLADPGGLHERAGQPERWPGHPEQFGDGLRADHVAAVGSHEYGAAEDLFLPDAEQTTW